MSGARKSPTTLSVTVPLTGRNAFRLVKVEIVRAALKATNGNITHAATLLGVHRQTFQRMIWNMSPYRRAA